MLICFYGDIKLEGWLGITYDSSKTDKTYARIDEGTSNKGYFSET